MGIEETVEGCIDGLELKSVPKELRLYIIRACRAGWRDSRDKIIPVEWIKTESELTKEEERKKFEKIFKTLEEKDATGVYDRVEQNMLNKSRKKGNYSLESIKYYVDRAPSREPHIGRACPVCPIVKAYNTGYESGSTFAPNEQGFAFELLSYKTIILEQEELKPVVDSLDENLKWVIDSDIKKFNTELKKIPGDKRLQTLRDFRNVVRLTLEGETELIDKYMSEFKKEHKTLYDWGLLLGCRDPIHPKESFETYFFYKINGIELNYAKKYLQKSGIKA